MRMQLMTASAVVLSLRQERQHRLALPNPNPLIRRHLDVGSRRTELTTDFRQVRLGRERDFGPHRRTGRPFPDRGDAEGREESSRCEGTTRARIHLGRRGAAPFGAPQSPALRIAWSIRSP